MMPTKRQALIALIAAALPLSAGFGQTRLYRWVDDQGVVHYGDRVPPEYANRDRDVLNDRGVTVDRQQGALTEAEQKALEDQKAAEAAERAARAEVARRDRMLLETYLSVADIEDLRDRRLELLESQIQVTELYIENLRESLDRLYVEAQRYKPYSDRQDAPELPADLAAEIESAENSIDVYEQQLQRTREDQVKLRSAFDADIERFRELKGG
ncbi:MAG: DUF4124 domain-containing protein [Gammaproteobacteria bacterium]|nr:DUF4124 domain-containing protein [Gammaproteobacteria bacterium]